MATSCHLVELPIERLDLISLCGLDNPDYPRSFLSLKKEKRGMPLKSWTLFLDLALFISLEERAENRDKYFEKYTDSEYYQHCFSL